MAQNPIDALLKAERDADRSLQEKQREAELVIEQALERARYISSRAQKRITNVHMRCGIKIKDQCDALWHDYHQEQARPTQVRFDEQTLKRITEKVAVKLIGGKDV